MIEATKLDFISEMVSEMIRKIDESSVPVEVSINYYPDGEVDVNISSCNFPLQYPCPTIPYPFTTTPNN